MRVSLNTLIDKVVWLLTVFLLTIFLVFQDRVWGRYAFLGISALIALLAAVNNGGILRVRLQAYHGFLLLFVVYMAINSLWAWVPADTISKTKTVAQILLCSAALYIYYQDKDDMHSLFLAVMWAGHFVTLYTILFYGLDYLTSIVGEERLGTEFANVNSVGMVAALACVLQVNELMHKRNIWATVMIIPAVMIIAASQSRKALIFLIAGVFCMYIVNTVVRNGNFKSFLKIACFVVVAIVGLRIILQLPMFSGVLERVDSMLAYWTDPDEADGSTMFRQQMIEVGITWFKKYPIGGMGIACPHVLCWEYVGKDSYLHNNFVELLCGGGILGFATYYAIYVYLFASLFKYRHADHELFAVGLVWLGLMLFMNYGMVTYYTKLQWYYLMFHCLNVNCLKKKHREMLQNAEKTAQSGA